MLKYVPFFPDMLTDHFEDLTDGEIGLIVKASLVYAADGTEPVFERRSVLALTWKRIRAHIDQCQEKQRAQEENGKKGGRPPKEDKPNETQQNPRKPNETQNNPTKPNVTQNNQEQEQEQEQDQDHAQEHDQEQTEEYTSAPAPDRGADQFRRNDEAGTGRVISLDDGTAPALRLVQTYMPASRSPGRDLRVDQIAEMIRRHGLEKVEAAMREATGSDSRGGLSVNFVRAVLERKPRAAPYQRRAYTQEDYARMEVDLSEELEAARLRG